MGTESASLLGVLEFKHKQNIIFLDSLVLHLKHIWFSHTLIPDTNLSPICFTVNWVHAYCFPAAEMLLLFSHVKKNINHFIGGVGGWSGFFLYLVSFILFNINHYCNDCVWISIFPPYLVSPFFNVYFFEWELGSLAADWFFKRGKWTRPRLLLGLLSQQPLAVWRGWVWMGFLYLNHSSTGAIGRFFASTFSCILFFWHCILNEH